MNAPVAKPWVGVMKTATMRIVEAEHLTIVGTFEVAIPRGSTGNLITEIKLTKGHQKIVFYPCESLTRLDVIVITEQPYAEAPLRWEQQQ